MKFDLKHFESEQSRLETELQFREYVRSSFDKIECITEALIEMLELRKKAYLEHKNQINIFINHLKKLKNEL